MLGAADAVLNSTIALLMAYYKVEKLGEEDWHYKVIFSVNFFSPFVQEQAQGFDQPRVSETELAEASRDVAETS